MAVILTMVFIIDLAYILVYLCRGVAMSRSDGNKGFTLIELLLVLAILGIISVIAIPSFLGQRRRARLIGDAQANTAVLRMLLEQRKADSGVYGTASTTYNWTASGTVPSASTNIAPTFQPKGNSKMDFSVAIDATGLAYTVTIKDTTVTGSPTAWVADQNSNGHVASTYKY